MTIALTVEFLAAIPVGHRVQILRLQHWTRPLFDLGALAWEDLPQPIVVDLDTGIVYCTSATAETLVPAPLAFKPNSGRRVVSMVEGRVTSCMVSAYGGDHALLGTALTVEPTPQGYRQ